MSNLPYGDIFVELLCQIHRALGYCHKVYSAGSELRNDDPELASFFKSFEKKYRQSGLNRHLTKGLSRSGQEKYKSFPRLSKLVIQSYVQTQELKKRSSNYKAIVLPSPLYILHNALTVPDQQQTSAYPFVLCRTILFYFFNIHPNHPDLEYLSNEVDAFGEEEILNSVSSFRNHIKIQARWPDRRAGSSTLTARVNLLNGHLFALKGIAHLWFEKEEELIKFCDIPVELNSIGAIKAYYAQPEYRFRLSPSYSDLPDASEVINWTFGIPIPIRGADILFYGGLKKTASSGLVISLHGYPGTGKTSAALSIASLLSPLDTKTIYISLEEEPEDLQIRINTLVPDYLKGLSIYKANPKGEQRWFSPFKISSSVSVEELTEILEILESDLRKQTFEGSIPDGAYTLPAVCPTLLVIDNINELFLARETDKQQFDHLEGFIQQCRNMGALVLLVSGEEIPKKINLDYLVDVSLSLKQTGINNLHEKPVRVLQLLKTRHQVSRQGAHVFHLSNSKGFRISPQVPSQMDKREKIKRLLPSEDRFIHTLNLLPKETHKSKNYLAIAAQSQILIHGYGSSGKAGFGLKLLFTPCTSSEEFRGVQGSRLITERNKVLIVSFLYSEEYYDGVYRKAVDQLVAEGFKAASTNVSYNVKSFYPGYLTPEDFVYKIVRLLDEANLEGEPYTGILLDGLHNIFLQFKNLQESHMVWPLLYSILSRYRLTVVTTFTNFSLVERHTGVSISDSKNIIQSPEDSMLLQQGQKPFLHGLVKAADYYFLLEEVIDDSNDYERSYWISVRGSIRQNPPKDYLEWDRNNLKIKRIISSSEVYGRTTHYNG